jgi:CPA2 family monovalent cation:H+ antiporter-2
MPPSVLNALVFDLLMVLGAGLLAGVVCRRLRVSMLVGYLLAGALIGNGALGLVSDNNHELHYLAEAGVLLLLFTIGIEFSLEELVRLSRYIFLAGTAQMVLVAVPVALAAIALGVPWRPALVLAWAVALSSTVLVYKALEEWGQTASAHGRRAVGILLFQDAALIPLVLLIPLLTGGAEGDGPGVGTFVGLSLKSLFLVVVVLIARRLIADLLVPYLARLRSVELLVLFAMFVLGGACLGAHALGLPPMIGAFAAGLAMNDNRLTRQIEALILPFRETFAAVFFVSLGSLMRFDTLIDAPVTAIAVLAGTLILKTTAGAAAIRLTGLPWRASLGMGLGLSQMGEFSFVILATAVAQGVISGSMYQLMLFVAVCTLVATPQLLSLGIRWARPERETAAPEQGSPRGRGRADASAEQAERAVIVGAGPIGRQAASQLEMKGVDVCLVDFNPVNLHPFAQQGFRTVAGDAVDPEVLKRAEVDRCAVAVVTVPDDAAAARIVQQIRQVNRQARIFVRCRYRANERLIRRSGADSVVSEEQEASLKMLAQLQRWQ